MKTDPRSSPMTLTSHERFFDESRLLSNRLNSAEDPFGQFVREHQERFAALTASIMGSTENSSASASSQASEVIGKQSSASTAFSNNNSENLEHESNREQPLALQPPSAADLVASILNGKSISWVSSGGHWPSVSLSCSSVLTYIRPDNFHSLYLCLNFGILEFFLFLFDLLKLFSTPLLWLDDCSIPFFNEKYPADVWTLQSNFVTF